MVNYDYMLLSHHMFSTIKDELKEGNPTFNFGEFYKVHSHIEPNWLVWFIGFVEGDGSLITRSNGRLTFILTQKEDLILYHIQEVLGFGRVTFDKDANSHRYIVEDLASIYKLAHLFNGNLVMDYRIDQLANWIKVLRAKDYPIYEILTPITISLQDAWLSGFTDAEGCFNVYTGKATGIRFILDQNVKEILEYVVVLFGGGAVTTRSSGSFRYQAGRLSHLVPIISYLESFPLKTKKRNSFILWCEAYSMIINKEHLTDKGQEAIRNIAKQINPK